MTIEITIPQLGSTKKSAKDLVISTLIYEHPLTIAQLTNSIKKKFGASVTFQGVRKAALQLIENGVLLKEGKKYSPSKQWIMELKNTVQELEEACLKEQGKIKEVESLGEDIKVYTFDNLIDSDVFWNKLINGWFEEDRNSKKEKYYVQQSGHTWYVLGNLEEETGALEKIKKHGIKCYTLVTGNTMLDKWAKKYYEEQGFFYTINENRDQDTRRYFAVYNNCVVQTEHPKELSKEIDNIYEKAKDFTSFEVTKLIQLLRKKCDIKLTVMRNPLIAEQLRNYILSNFKII